MIENQKILNIKSDKKYLSEVLKSVDELSGYEFVSGADGLAILDSERFVEVGGIFFEKPLNLRKLVSHIVSITERREFMLDDFKFQPGIRRVYGNDQEIVLTEKESAIVTYLIENKGIEITKSEILSKVWGYDSSANTTTVETHIYRLRAKLASIGLNNLIAVSEKTYSIT